MSHRDDEIDWKGIGQALGFVLTVFGLISLLLMVLAVASLAIGDGASPVR